jgi:vacuolar-type H+-ATPase subunit H
MTGSLNDPELLRAEIAQARAELADTVDQLSAKLDVKQQARQRVDETKASAVQRLREAKQRAPQPVGQALDKLSEAVLPVLSQAVQRARANPQQALVAATVVVVITLIGRRAGGKR